MPVDLFSLPALFPRAPIENNGAADMSDFSNSTIAVTGAAGQLGRAVVGYLRARGAKHIVAVTRDPAKLAGLQNVEVRRGDFDDAGSLEDAFKGVDRLLVISTDTFP